MSVKSVRTWVAVNRPDLVPSFDRIIRMEARGQEEGRALLALIVIGWSAGRQYQHDHPEDWPELVAQPSPTEAL